MPMFKGSKNAGRLPETAKNMMHPVHGVPIIPNLTPRMRSRVTAAKKSGYTLSTKDGVRLKLYKVGGGPEGTKFAVKTTDRKGRKVTVFHDGRGLPIGIQTMEGFFGIRSQLAKRKQG